MWGRLTTTTCISAALLIFAASGAQAGIVATAPGALVSGTANHFEAPGGFSFLPGVDVDADYAVFAPGDFQTFLNDNAIVALDPSGGASFVYVYQLFNVAAPPGAGTELFTVGVDALDPLDGAAPTFISLLGSVDPATTAFNGGTNSGPTSGVDGSVVWDFDAALGVGQSSALLVYTSPRSFQFDTSTATASLSSGGSEVPSPLPEPHTLVVLAMAGLGAMARRRGA
jgi:hypothetical protein